MGESDGLAVGNLLGDVEGEELGLADGLAVGDSVKHVHASHTSVPPSHFGDGDTVGKRVDGDAEGEMVGVLVA